MRSIISTRGRSWPKPCRSGWRSRASMGSARAAVRRLCHLVVEGWLALVPVSTAVAAAAVASAAVVRVVVAVAAAAVASARALARVVHPWLPRAFVAAVRAISSAIQRARACMSTGS